MSDPTSGRTLRSRLAVPRIPPDPAVHTRASDGLASPPRDRRRGGAARAMLAVTGGAATGLAVLAGSWWLAVLGIGAVAAAVHRLPPGRRFTVAFLAGGTHLVTTSLWVAAFSLPGVVLLVSLQAAGWGLAGLFTSRRAQWPWPFAAALAISEWARSWWPLGGYPLSQLWLSQADGPLAALAPLAGPLALTAVLALLGAAAAAMLDGGGRRPATVTLVGLLGVLAAAGLLRPPAPTANLEVAAVQGGGPRGIPAVRNDPAPLFDRQVALTRDLGTDLDLVVWPENAVGVDGELSDADRRPLSDLAAGFDGLLVAGLIERFDRAEGAGRFTNSAIAIDDRTVLDRYDKRIPVPFGERVPARRLLERVIDLSLVPRDMTPGDDPPILRTDLVDMGVAISYENLFARVAREATRQGAELLVVPTNASSYVTDEVPVQQLAGARIRARETGRDLVLGGAPPPPPHSSAPTAAWSAKHRSRNRTSCAGGWRPGQPQPPTPGSAISHRCSSWWARWGRWSVAEGRPGSSGASASASASAEAVTTAPWPPGRSCRDPSTDRADADRGRERRSPASRAPGRTQASPTFSSPMDRSTQPANCPRASLPPAP